MGGWKQWLRPPVAGDSEEAVRAEVTHWTLITTMVAVLTLVAFIPAVERQVGAMLAMCLAALATAAISFTLLHRGRVRAAGAIFCGLALVVVLGGIVLVGDVRSPHLATGMFVVILTGFLVGTRVGIWAGLGFSTTLLFLTIGRDAGWVPETSLAASPYTTWGAFTAILALTTIFVHLFVEAMHAAQREAAEQARLLRVEMERREEAEASLHRAEKLEALGRLTGGIAHDFNNILTILLAECALLERSAEAGRALSRQEIEEIGEIRHASERAAALTGQLMSFARQRVGNPIPIDPNEAIRKLEPLLRRMMPEGIQLWVAPLEATGSIRIDPSQFEQIVMNLVLNARDAIAPGGRIEVSTCETELDFEWTLSHATSQPGPHLVLEVADDGMGIAPADLDRIFDPFFTTKAFGRGTGLGLATVDGIVRRAGGHVTVDSTPGRGARFRVYLPLATEVAHVAEPNRASFGSVGERTILLCDDNAAVRRVTRRILIDFGFNVLEADSKEAALMVVRSHSGTIDVLLADVVMPGGTGVELALAVREQCPDVRVLLKSGYASTGEPEEEEHSWMAFLEKPFSPDRLRQSLEDVLC